MGVCSGCCALAVTLTWCAVALGICRPCSPPAVSSNPPLCSSALCLCPVPLLCASALCLCPVPQMSSLSESLNATLVGVTAHSQQLQGRRERALGEARLGQGLAGGQEGQGRGLGLGAGLGGDSGSDPGLSERAVEQELLRVVGKVEEKVEEAGERSASVLGRVEEKLGLLAGRLDSLAHSSALKASPSVLHMEGQQAGAGSEGHGGGRGLPADGEALRRIEAQVVQLAAGLGKGPAGKEAVAGGVGTEVASQVARLLENVRRLRESSGAGDGTRRRPENGTTLAGAGAGAAAGGVAGLGSAGGDQVGPRVPGTGAGSGAGEGTGEPRQCAALASQVRRAWHRSC